MERMGSTRWIVSAAWTWLAISSAHAQVELRNDGFQAGGQVGFQSGFCEGEIGAARFLAPAAGRQLLKVRFLFGATVATRMIGLTVWDDSAGTDVPGQVLFTSEYQVMGSPNGMVETDLSAQGIILPQQFRIGVGLRAMGQPSIARDSDGTIAADRNFVQADSACAAGGPFTWYRAQAIGVTGDWVIRAEISATGPGGGDAGPEGPDGGTGQACGAGVQCPLGQYCDLDLQVCRSDCTSDAQCGTGTCSSTGECRPATGDGGGCQVNGSGALAGGLVLLGLLGLARRRVT